MILCRRGWTFLRSLHHAKLVPKMKSQSQQQCSDIAGERLSRYDFWKDRYKNADSLPAFDWFLGSSSLLDSLQQHLHCLQQDHTDDGKILKFLDVGCGLSDVPLALYKQSTIPLSVTCLDYVSSVVRKQQREGEASLPANSLSTFNAVCGDVLQLPFQSNLFDMVLDKGTMDALLKNRQEGEDHCGLMLNEVLRILRGHGRFVQISDEDPDTRLLLLEKLAASSCSKVVENVTDTDTKSIYDEHEVDCKQSESNKLFSSWNFKVMTNLDFNSDQEYFMYWTHKKIG